MTAILLLGMAYSYRRWILPVETHRAELVERSERVRDRLQRAENEMKAIKERQQHGSAIRQSLRTLQADLPSESAMIWFPSYVKSLLGNLGVAEVNVRLNKTGREPLLLGFERNYWFVAVPPQDERKMTDVLLAIAQIETLVPVAQIEGLSIQLETQEPKGPGGYVNLGALVHQ